MKISTPSYWSGTKDSSAKVKWFLAVFTAITIIGLATLTVVLALDKKNFDRENADREILPRLASEQVTAMYGYNYSTVKETLPAAANGLSSKFRDDYLKLVEQTVIPAAIEKQITVETNVTGSAVISVEQAKASVLVLMNQIVTSSVNPEATVSASRSRVIFIKSDSRWLVDSVERF
ncbi:MAG: hypothetical protein ACRCSF_13525 [Mycobacteriaceae bacterium]